MGLVLWSLGAVPCLLAQDVPDFPDDPDPNFREYKVTVEVVDARGSHPPLAGATVRLVGTEVRLGGPSPTVVLQAKTTGPNGEVTFEFTNFVENDYDLAIEVTRAGYEPNGDSFNNVTQPENFTPNDDGELRVEIDLRRKAPPVRELLARSSESPDVDILRYVSGVLPPDVLRRLDVALLGSGLEEPDPRSPLYTAGIFSFDSPPAATVQKSFVPSSFGEALLPGGSPRWEGVPGSNTVAAILASDAHPAASGEPAFELFAAGRSSGPSFLACTFDGSGELLDCAIEAVGADCIGGSSQPVTTDRDGTPGALFFCEEDGLLLDVDADGRRNVPDVRPGPGNLIDVRYGGFQPQAVSLPGPGGAGAGTLTFSSNSAATVEEGDFDCKPSSLDLLMTEHSAAGARVAQSQLGEAVPALVGDNCYPDHTQQTAAARFGNSFAVGYQVGSDLRLSTRSLDSGSEPRTYSLGPQPPALDGRYFWQYAMLGDRDSGSILVDVPNGPAFEGAEDGERLGIAPWRLSNPTLDLPLVANGELISHAIVPDLTGLGWLVGTFERDVLGDDAPAGDSDQLIAEVAIPGCADTDTTLCAGHNRFAVSARFETPQGTVGRAHTRPLSIDSGTMWFFGPANRELIVKVLPACAINGYHWFFAAGLTDVEVHLQLRDEVTGATKLYLNPQGRSFRPILDTRAIPCDGSAAASAMEEAARELRGSGSQVTLIDPATPSPRADGTACGGRAEDLCLKGGRFRVEVDFVDPSDGLTPAFGGKLTDDTGALFFFDRTNVELLVKVLDACVFGNYWIYAAGLTDVELEVRVFDTSTGQTATYRNAAGQPFRPVADTSTFDGCFL